MTIKIGTFYSVQTHYYDCGGPPVQQKGGSTPWARDCVGDIAVLTPRVLFAVAHSLGFGKNSPEHLWLADPNNSEEFFQIKGFLDANKINGEISYSAKAFCAWVVTFEILPNTPCGVGHDCVKSIKLMADGLRSLHGQDGVLMADYFDSLVSDYASFTKSDLQVFYDTAKAITDDYNNRMFDAITGGFVAGVTPILEIALFEVGAPIAIKLLQRIPISWVYRGTRLNNMVKKVGLMGKMGYNNSIREFATNAPVTKARELFNSLTKHAISKTTESNGLIKANMGNGNFITYRPITASSSNVPATLSLDFRAAGIWTQVRDVKFILP